MWRSLPTSSICRWSLVTGWPLGRSTPIAGTSRRVPSTSSRRSSDGRASSTGSSRVACHSPISSRRWTAGPKTSSRFSPSRPGRRIVALRIGRETCRNLESALTREWLVTNGLGGFASGTVAGVNTRRYHGLLVAAMNPPVQRMVLLAALEEWLLPSAGEAVPLAAHEYWDGTVYPEGFVHLDGLELDGMLPVFRWTAAGRTIEKRIWMEHETNRSVISYRLVTGPADAGRVGGARGGQPPRVPVGPGGGTLSGRAPDVGCATPQSGSHRDRRISLVHGLGTRYHDQLARAGHQARHALGGACRPRHQHPLPGPGLDSESLSRQRPPTGVRHDGRDSLDVSRALGLPRSQR